MSQFAFLQREWPPVFEAAGKAEAAVHADPRTACFYARRALELAVAWAYKHDAALKLPYQDNLSALIHEPSFKQAAGEAVFSKARVINTLGNRAVHSHRAIPPEDALAAVRELFHVTYWLARTYARAERPAPGLVFEAGKLPEPAPAPRQTAEQLQQLETALRDRDEKLAALLADKSALDEELKRLRAEVAEAKKAAAGQPDTHDYSESETRDYYIDLLLKEAGWPLNQARDREFEVTGMPNKEGKGFVDYVLWGDDGKPLGLVEAKRTRRDPRVGQQQAKLYADCLERQFGQRPLIFYSNGYEHWLWDDASYPPREVQGFYKKAELELVIQRRASRKPLAAAEINLGIVERFYQTRGIRRIAEALEHDHDRKALLVMATGAGKTRTVIALADLLMRCNWVKRVLFLADRVALVRQAVNAFKRHLPDAAPVNLVTEKDAEGRVFVSTYPTMMGLIDETRDGQRRFGVGHFDLVIIDEAHRSVFQKYRAIFDYFDSLLVGLTATPKDEVDRNTYSLFDLENGVPTDAYSLEEAVRDAFLVPPKAVSVPLKFQREGIKYADLSEEDKDQWDALEWDEDGGVPDRVEAEAEVRHAIGELLHREVAAMNPDNFVVRPRRRIVEKYARPEAWTVLSAEALSELSHEVAGLPSDLEAEAEEAKRFDLLLLRLQLALLRVEPGFERLRDQVKEIAGLIEEKSAIPMVREQMGLIQELQTDEWWQDVTTPMLEIVRRRLRDLVKLIDKQKRKPIYSDFEDLMGGETDFVLPGFGEGTDYAKFRAKARAFLRAHQDHMAIHKLRMNKALTAADLAELERILVESGVGVAEDVSRAKAESQGLGLFVRSLVGMDRGAAKEALAGFLAGKTLAANQIEFVNLIVNHLTEHGVMDAALLYESPFTDLTPRGPDGIFSSSQVDELMALLAGVRATAIAA